MPTQIPVTSSSPVQVPVAEASAALVSALNTLATSPQRVRTDEGTVEERPLKEVIQADVYNRLDAQQPVKSASIMTRWGISVARTRPPDALGQQKPDPFGPRFL